MGTVETDALLGTGRKKMSVNAKRRFGKEMPVEKVMNL
jgi:hypothetical protein